MTAGKKALIALTILAVITATVVYTVRNRNRDVVEVQTERVVLQELVQSVTASGEIKPKKYVNIGSNAMGRIVDLAVAEKTIRALNAREGCRQRQTRSATKKSSYRTLLSMVLPSAYYT